MSQPQVNVVVVNWNGLEHLQACLPSLEKMTYSNVKVVVVDNGSRDGSPDFVSTRFPAFFLLRNERNLGFTGGNNLGIQFALGEGANYVALLNNDTRVEPDWIDALVDVAEQDTAIALCEAQQHSWDGHHRIRLRLRPDWLEGVPTLEAPDRTPGICPTAYAAGCCVLMRSSALQRIGAFDSRYFAYVEDVDLSLRAWIAGYKVVSVGHSVIYHRTQGTTRPHTDRMRWGYRNQLTTMLKNYEWSTLFAFRRSILARWFFTRNRLALRSTLSVLSDLPMTMARRRSVQAMRLRSDEEIFALTGLVGEDCAAKERETAGQLAVDSGG
jgi:GT2 family glycosyltransferase